MQVIDITHPNPADAKVTVELSGIELAIVRMAVLNTDPDTNSAVVDALGVDYDIVVAIDGNLYSTLTNICTDLGITL